MADETTTPAPTTTPEVNPVAGVTYPWPGNDSVVGAAEQAFQDGQQVLRQQLFRQAAGDNNTSETSRNNFSSFNLMSMAVISQQMNGTDPLLAANTLAYNAIARQPFVGNQGGGGVKPVPAGTTPAS